MNHEIEYFNHKIRLTELRQEAKDMRLSESVKQTQEDALSGASIRQKLSVWMSRFKSQGTAISETPVAYDPALQQK